MKKTRKNIFADTLRGSHLTGTLFISVCALCLLMAGTAFGQMRSNPNVRGSSPAPAPGGGQGVAARDLANLRSDFSILQEENQKLNLRMENLEQALRERDEIIRDLQNRLRLLSDQIADNDRAHREHYEQLGRDISVESQDRKAEMRKMAEKIAKELSSGGGKPVSSGPKPPVHEYTSEYEIRVEKGDTLSSIAKAAGIPWSELKRYNGLKSDIIREGQRLKIPQK